jgi:DNA-binding response OmpR family regulator
MSRAILALILHDLGYNVGVATSLAEIKELSIAISADLLLIDIDDLNMDVEKWALQLRKTGLTNPIVAITSQSLTKDDQIYAVFSSALKKPLTHSMIKRTIREAFLVKRINEHDNKHEHVPVVEGLQAASLKSLLGASATGPMVPKGGLDDQL